MKLIDTHCHIYADEFIEDFDTVLSRSKEVQVEQILMPNIDVSSIDRMLQIAEENPNFLIPMMGLHPCYVKEDFETQLAIIEKHLFTDTEKYCAVGEIGIDLYWDKTTLPVQQTAFRRQIEWALELDLPIAIHARDSMEEILDILREYYPKGKGGVLHCFGGNQEQADELIKLGFYLGIGGVATFKKSTDIRDVIAKTPLDRIILETDAPYLSPHPKRGKRNEPSYVQLVAEKLVDVYQLEYSEICQITSTNAKQLFDL